MKDNELQNNGQTIGQINVPKVKRVSNEGVFMSVSKKAEKIATALYMVTDLIKDGDPMRQKVRETSIVILSDTRALSYAVTGDLYFHLGRVIAKSWELVSLMEVCAAVGFVSDMNYGILKNALIEFIGDLRNRQKVEGFTNIQDLKIVTGEAGNFKLKPDFFKLNEEDIKVIKEATEETETKRHPLKTLSDRKMSFTSNVKADQKTSSLLSSIKTSSSAREEQILKLIEDKKDISINDIVSYFKGLSPKTIQRDLVSLVASGKIKKKGERRWSRYFI
jgi:DNA-binding transcriptional ArsR family regulator